MPVTTKMFTTTGSEESFLRLHEVLDRIPVSRSTWYEGVKTGRYPSPVKLGARVAAWRHSDITNLVASFAESARP